MFKIKLHGFVRLILLITVIPLYGFMLSVNYANFSILLFILYCIFIIILESVDRVISMEKYYLAFRIKIYNREIIFWKKEIKFHSFIKAKIMTGTLFSKVYCITFLDESNKEYTITLQGLIKDHEKIFNYFQKQVDTKI